MVEINDIMTSLAIDMDAIIDSDIKIPSKIKSFFHYIVMVLLCIYCDLNANF